MGLDTPVVLAVNYGYVILKIFLIFNILVNAIISRLRSMFARIKLKKFDGDLTLQWNMCLNSMLREKPYQNLTI